jgi:hypothetical protein
VVSWSGVAMGIVFFTSVTFLMYPFASAAFYM